MKLYVFTKKDIDRFLTECNFTPDEEKLFRLRCQEHTLEYCAEQMNVSISTAKRLSRSDGRDAYDDYMTQKQSYRSGKSEDCKRKMLAALEEHLDELTTEMSDMSKDAECREERDLVKRYVEKLRDML